MLSDINRFSFLLDLAMLSDINRFSLCFQISIDLAMLSDRLKDLAYAFRYQ